MMLRASRWLHTAWMLRALLRVLLATTSIPRPDCTPSIVRVVVMVLVVKVAATAQAWARTTAAATAQAVQAVQEAQKARLTLLARLLVVRLDMPRQLIRLTQGQVLLPQAMLVSIQVRSLGLNWKVRQYLRHLALT